MDITLNCLYHSACHSPAATNPNKPLAFFCQSTGGPLTCIETLTCFACCLGQHCSQVRSCAAHCIVKPGKILQGNLSFLPSLCLIPPSIPFTFSVFSSLSRLVLEVIDNSAFPRDSGLSACVIFSSKSARYVERLGVESLMHQRHAWRMQPC